MYFSNKVVPLFAFKYIDILSFCYTNKAINLQVMSFFEFSFHIIHK